MSKYNFEGDLDDINDRQLEYINDAIVKQGFINPTVKFEVLGIPGDNYAANVKRVSIEDANRTLSLVIKVAPANEMQRAALNTHGVFKNEHIMYTEVLPRMQNLQKAAGVPEEDQLRFAKCYGSLSEAPNEVILLEDLKTSNFIMMDRFASLSDDCMKSVMKNFAILHSLSYVLKAKEPETFDRFKSSLFDMWIAMSDIPESSHFLKSIEENTASVLEDPEHKNILRNKVTDILPLSLKMAKFEDGNKYSVIQQGDAWTNNIMFRFEEDALKESIMIDYQLSRNNNPVCDILYLVLNCVDHETRVKHYHDWIDYYYSELDKSLFNFGLKANFIYPRDRLDADLKRYAKLMFGMCILLAHVLTRKPDEAKVMRDSMANSDISVVVDGMTATCDETAVRLRSRVGGLIQTYQHFGLF